MLYSSYALPNTIFPFFMGYVVDLIGRPYCLIIFIFIVSVGQAIFSLSAHDSIRSYWIAFAGRFIFGAFGKSVSGNIGYQ